VHYFSSSISIVPHPLQVYLIMLTNRAMMPHAKSTYCAAHLMKSPRRKCCDRYWKHIATQTITCRLLAHMCMLRLEIHLVDLLSTYYTSTFQQIQWLIEPMELKDDMMMVFKVKSWPSSFYIIKHNWIFRNV